MNIQDTIHQIRLRMHRVVIVFSLLTLVSCAKNQSNLCKENSSITVVFCLSVKEKYQPKLFELIDQTKTDSLRHDFLKLISKVVESIHSSGTELVDSSGGIDKSTSIINGCSSIKDYEFIMKDLIPELKKYQSDLKPFLETKVKNDAFAITTLLDSYVNDENGYFNKAYLDEAVVNTCAEDLFMLEFLVLDQVIP